MLLLFVDVGVSVTVSLRLQAQSAVLGVAGLSSEGHHETVRPAPLFGKNGAWSDVQKGRKNQLLRKWFRLGAKKGDLGVGGTGISPAEGPEKFIRLGTGGGNALLTISGAVQGRRRREALILCTGGFYNLTKPQTGGPVLLSLGSWGKGCGKSLAPSPLRVVRGKAVVRAGWGLPRTWA